MTTQTKTKNLDRVLLGRRLLKLGFRVWFLYMFRLVNGTEFIEEKLHRRLFRRIQRIIDGNDTRLNINLCPRSGKTTINQWLCVYALTINPRSQIIYTSFNQDLLSQISQAITGIMTHPAYIAMYSNGADITETIEDVDPIDDFWREYLLNTTGKAKFSSRKIITAQGGIILFNSIGSAITGFGAGVRNAKGFSGMLCIDDGDKPTEVRSEKIRSKTHTYFVETLLTRLNNSDTPITNTQQRLHQDDLSGFLEENYKFDTFKFPLLDEDGKCNLPKQYTDRRIKELQVDAYTFSAQYQQEPIMLGGGVIKHDWWRFYKDIEDVRYRRIFITADTANKTKEWNDYTAIGVWGLTTGNRLRLLDLVHGKLEIPELQATMLAIYDKWKQGIGTCRCTAIYIEDKASGTQVIQQLRRAGGLPILPFIPDKDKLTRVQDALPQIAAGNVELPESDKHPMSKLLIDEADAFSADMSHIHDDLVDMLTSAVSQAYNAKGYF